MCVYIYIFIYNCYCMCYFDVLCFHMRHMGVHWVLSILMLFSIDHFTSFYMGHAVGVLLLVDHFL